MAEAWTAEDIARLRETGGMLTNAAAPSAVDIRNVPSSDIGVLVSPNEFENTGFEQRATRSGVPFDPAGEAPSLDRLLAGTIRSKMDQLNFWRSKYGQDKIDVVDGQFIIRDVPNDQGELRDIPVDPMGGSFGNDVLDLMGEVPEMILALAAARKGESAAMRAGLGRFGKFFTEAASAGLAFSGAGALKDIGQRATLSPDGVDLQDVREIGMMRGGEAAFEAGVGTLLPAGLGAILSKLSPNPRTLSAIEGADAIQRIKSKTGQELPQSLAERIGSQSLARAEAFLEKFPWTRERIAAMRKARIDAERRLQEFFMRGPEPEAGELGERAVGALQSQLRPSQSAVKSARKDAIQSAADESVAPLMEARGQSRSALDLGESLRSGAVKRYDTFKADSRKLYDAVYELPEATQDVFSLGPVAGQAREIIEKLPSTPAQAKKVPGFDAYGSPTEVTVTPEAGAREQMKELTPAGILSIVEPLAGRKGQKTRLFDLVQSRQRIFDLINTAQPISDIPQGDLKQLAGSITEAIQKGADELPSGELKNRLEAANAHFRDKIGTFQQKGIEELLVDPKEQRSNLSEQLVSQIFSGGKGSAARYKQFKDFYGEKSPEVNDLRQFFLDSVLERGTRSGTRTVEFGEVRDALRKLAPEISNDLFGGGTRNMIEAANLGSLVDADKRVNIDEIKALILDNKLTASNVRRLAQTEDALDRELRNQIKSAVVQNRLDPAQVDPAEFVDRYLLSDKVNNADIKDAMRAFESSGDPRLAQAVKTKFLADLFRRSSVTGDASEDLTRRALGQQSRELDPQKFSLLFDSPDTRGRVKAVLGDESYELMRDFSLAVSGRGMKDTMAGAAGSLAAGNFLNELILFTGGLKNSAKYLVASFILSSPQTVRLMRNASSIPEQAGLKSRALMQSLVMSPLFVEELFDNVNDPMQISAIAADLKENLIDEQPTQR